MAIRNLLSRFRSLRRPSLTSSSGAFSSLAKKQASAEDLIVDNLYSEGNMDVSTYMGHLRTRLTRPWNTPRTEVSLQEKIESASEDIKDSEIARAHQAGEITTRDRFQYESNKLGQMQEPGSQAYINQSRLVQSLKDQSEKQERSAFRAEQLNQLSQMPEDTSEKLAQKASLYETLSHQARIDGDEGQALTLETQANNYRASAEKANINDFINQTRLSVSETQTQGLGVPTAEGGVEAFSNLTGVSAPGITTSTTNALKALDRQEQTLERMYGQRQDKSTMIQAYQQAVDAASGDQKTQLTIALNNLQDGLLTLDNSIANTTANIEGTITKIQDAQIAAAGAVFKRQVRENEKQLESIEDQLENEFKEGNVSKVEYVEKGRQLAVEKSQYFQSIATEYSNMGDESNFEKYTEKTDESLDLNDVFEERIQNIDDYEPLFVDSESPLTNISGEKVAKGDIVLTDVRRQKQSGKFDESYSLVDGVYHRVYYPATWTNSDGVEQPLTDDDGFLINDSDIRKIAKNNNLGFINNTNENGKLVEEPVTFVTELRDGKKISIPIQNDKLSQMVDAGVVVGDEKKGFDFEAGIEEKEGTPEALEKSIPFIKDIRETFEKETGNFDKGVTLSQIVNVGFTLQNVQQKLFEGVTGAASGFFKRVTEGVGDFFGGAKDAIEGFDIVPEAIASDVSSPVAGGFAEGTPTEYQDLIASAANKYGLTTDLLSSLIKQESNFNPNAVSSVGATGLTQLMPATAEELGVTDATDPVQAIEGGAKYLAQQIKRYDGDIDLGLAAYNAGAGNVDDFLNGTNRAGNNPNKIKTGGIPPFTETEGYVKRINGFLGNVFQTAPPTDQEFDDRNLNNAFGFSKGELEAGRNPTSDEIDRAYRSDQSTVDLLNRSGFAQAKQPEPVQPVTPVAPIEAPKSTVRVSGKPIQDFFVKPQTRERISDFASDFGKTTTRTASNVGRGVSNIFGNIGSFARNVGADVRKNPERLNVIKQAQALPELVSQTAKKAVKSAGSFLNRFNPFR